LEGVPISDLCDELGLQPTVFYYLCSIPDSYSRFLVPKKPGLRTARGTDKLDYFRIADDSPRTSSFASHNPVSG